MQVGVTLHPCHRAHGSGNGSGSTALPACVADAMTAVGLVPRVCESASPQSTDVRRNDSWVSWRPNCGLMHCNKIASLFDHLVGARKQRRRHVEAEHLGCDQVDDQVELSRLLD